MLMDSYIFSILYKLIRFSSQTLQGYEVSGVFLDISKAFDKVWHKGIIHKLKQNIIGGPLLKILTDFLKSRKQRVVLNGQHSSWSDVLTGVSQGSILGPLLLLIFINDFSNGLVTQNCLQMISHYLQQCIISK